MDETSRKAARRRAIISFVAAGALVVASVIGLAVTHDGPGRHIRMEGPGGWDRDAEHGQFGGDRSSVPAGEGGQNRQGDDSNGGRNGWSGGQDGSQQGPGNGPSGRSGSSPGQSGAGNRSNGDGRPSDRNADDSQSGESTTTTTAPADAGGI